MNVYIERNALPLFPDVPHDIMFRLNPPETSHASSWMTGPLHRFAGDFHNCVFVICDTTAALKRSVPPPRGDGGTTPGPPPKHYKKHSIYECTQSFKEGHKGIIAPPKTHTHK